MNKDEILSLRDLLKTAKKELEKAQKIVAALTCQGGASKQIGGDICEVINKYLDNAEVIVTWIENAVE